VPYSATLTDEDGNMLQDLPENLTVKIKNTITNEVIVETTISTADSLSMLIPDLNDFTIEIENLNLF
jgi:hypothetical protein